MATEHASMGLPRYDLLKTALRRAQGEDNGGLGNHMWATVVDRDGIIRTVVFTGDHRGDQWPGSRIISAQKAFTANGFSLAGFGLSTANLFAGSQQWNFLYRIDLPTDTMAAYAGDPERFGQEDDPLVGKIMGGTCVFGGGLALYNATGSLIGGLGVSGDFSCVDHIIAWKVRDYLALDHVAKGSSPTGDDNIIFDIGTGKMSGLHHSASGFGHPECSPESTKIAKKLPETHPIGK